MDASLHLHRMKGSRQAEMPPQVRGTKPAAQRKHPLFQVLLKIKKGTGFERVSQGT